MCVSKAKNQKSTSLQVLHLFAQKKSSSTKNQGKREGLQETWGHLNTKTNPARSTTKTPETPVVLYVLSKQLPESCDEAEEDLEHSPTPQILQRKQKNSSPSPQASPGAWETKSPTETTTTEGRSPSTLWNESGACTNSTSLQKSRTQTYRPI